jgi:hypothetical protein
LPADWWNPPIYIPEPTPPIYVPPPVVEIPEQLEKEKSNLWLYLAVGVLVVMVFGKKRKR